MAFPIDMTGTRLDRYEIKERLGKGGMGAVYEAVHVALEQRVAIKVLHARFAHESRYRERFLREARSASRIKHRNVVRITDFGETPDGSVYFAMELLAGRDLRAELRRAGAMPWPRVRHILLQAAQGLAAAHEQDIIHRDIKPANCFLSTEGGIADLVKLVDFGIAKIGSESQTDAQGKGLTGTGEVFGTVAYMSPEQAAGEELDSRSDMYSLGVMAYEMLVGRVPFTGANSVHVITRHMKDAPVPLRTHDCGIPEPVEALVLKTLEKKRDDRFESMAELVAELRAIPETASRGARRRTQFWKGPKERAETSPRGSIGSDPTEVGQPAADVPVRRNRGGSSTAVVSPPVLADTGLGDEASRDGGDEPSEDEGQQRISVIQTTPKRRVLSPRADEAPKPPSRRAPEPPVESSVRAPSERSGRAEPAEPPPSFQSRRRTLPATPFPLLPAGGGRPRVSGGPPAAPPGREDPSVPPPVVAGSVEVPIERVPSVPLPRSVEPSGPGASVEHGGQVSVAVTGDSSVPPPGRVDPSVPPPGRTDPSMPPPGRAGHSAPSPAAIDHSGLPMNWAPDHPSTGPHPGVSDSSTETSPQRFQTEVPPLLTARAVAVVGMLVVLVSVLSTMTTALFLTFDEGDMPSVVPWGDDGMRREVPPPVVSPTPADGAGGTVVGEHPRGSASEGSKGSRSGSRGGPEGGDGRLREPPPPTPSDATMPTPAPERSDPGEETEDEIILIDDGDDDEVMSR